MKHFAIAIIALLPVTAWVRRWLSRCSAKAGAC
jgi:hypothetical protein